MTDNVGSKLRLTASIVSAYVSKNSVPMSNLADLVASVHASLHRLDGQPEKVEQAPLVPAVPIKKSVTPDYLISLEDGRKFKSLKRHLNSRYGMTPEDYRAKWGLPADYPMVAPNYAATRSELAKTMGLGRKADGTEEGDMLVAPAEDPAPSKPKARRGRRPKSE